MDEGVDDRGYPVCLLVWIRRVERVTGYRDVLEGGYGWVLVGPGVYVWY